MRMMMLTSLEAFCDRAFYIGKPCIYKNPEIVWGSDAHIVNNKLCYERASSCSLLDEINVQFSIHPPPPPTQPLHSPMDTGSQIMCKGVLRSKILM